MVSEGLAVSSGRYWTEEASARHDRLGIWAGDFDAPRDWRDDHPRPQGAWGWLAAFGL
jgi:endonuclease YncB( thermonuclease family)